MKKLIFQVEFLSDIVLPASSNTEGNISQLEFIPGSNFLGMVAKKYGEFSNSFDIFHSGKVRFGDATLLVEGEEAYKMPLSFFHPKLDENRIFKHHYLDLLGEEQRKELGQLKQMRSGYLLPDISQGIKVKHINYNYAQKSAYDSTKRRNKTSSMYGYRAIAKGTKWQFMVKYDETMSSDDIDLLKTTLVDSKRLGKSKSAQYGQIKISEAGSTTNLSTDVKAGEEVVLYAKSRIALVDKEGNATYDLQYLFDGAKVLYNKCQIRTSTFTPYNGAMQTKTYERLVIEAGSVILLKSLSESQKKMIEQGVGIYLADGFGELIVNPTFLMEKKEMTFVKEVKEKSKKEDQRKELKDEFENKTVQFLVNRHNEEIKRLKLADEVQKFVDDNKALYKNIKNAQWGTIRSICTNNSETYIEDIKEYIESGKVSWKKEQVEALLLESYSLEFIKMVAIQMPKEGDN